MTENNLYIDIGNTSITFALPKQQQIEIFYQIETQVPIQFDLLKKQLQYLNLQAIGIASVVLSVKEELVKTLKKLLPNTPIFEVTCKNIDLIIPERYQPKTLGNDRIACALGGLNLFPNKDLIIIDFGTATTVCSVSKNKQFRGGAIMPGVKTLMEALKIKAPALKKYMTNMNFKQPASLGTNTQECIESGIYYGHLGSIKEIIKQQIGITHFNTPTILATGGYADFFAKEKLFHHKVDHLIFEGIKSYLTSL